MTPREQAQDLSRRVLDGDRRALTRVLTFVENGYPEGKAALKALFSRTGRAHIVGMTGPTCSGKSTLTGALAREYRRLGRSVGVVAVDPTSPFSHGAILGDRIRMQDLTSDPEVFIRSMATRGAMGGLSATTGDVVTVLDAAGKDVIIVETVGAGQDEVDIADTAHTTVVINVPGAGDDMQAIKAGILEIADILVVNKADNPGAEATFKQLHIFTDLQRNEGWDVPILKTVAHRAQGIHELLEAIDKHREYLRESGRLEEMTRKRARRQLLAVAQKMMLERVMDGASGEVRVSALVEGIASREIDPHTAAERLIAGGKGN
ncbi:MAG TPA: methylmalonyl Co-A mutase-associated GTPase MeaB [Dehalococcoidia bacterium]|nr:methylmalonyl Co-A mutase-associated GTPase MeaB [Dehalococcoidia bacterium]